MLQWADAAVAAASAAHQAGRIAEAEAGYRAVLARLPRHADALYYLGVLAYQKPDFDTARRLFDLAIDSHPGHGLAHYLRGHIGRVEHDSLALWRHWRMAAALLPDHAGVWLNLGTAASAGGNRDPRPFARRATLLDPRDPVAWYNLATNWHGHDRADAVRHYRRSLTIAPAQYAVWHNYSMALQYLGDVRAALIATERTVALDPSYQEGLIQRGFLKLQLDDYPGGFADYEARWWRTAPARPLDLPLWRGESLAGKTLFVQAEQGFGDCLTIMRFLPDLAARAAHLVVEMPRDLVQLATRSLAGVSNLDVIGPDTPTPAADCQVGMMTVPLWLGTTLATLPTKTPYLLADSGAAATWRQRLAGPGLKIGIAWSGNPTQTNDATRSMSLDQLAPLRTVTGVKLFSIQKQLRESDKPILLAWDEVTDLGPELRDFDTTAAIASALDLVVTIDSAMAHLAGGLGLPTWVLLCFACDWRYGLEGSSCRWYPSQRLFRQPRLGDWPGAVAQMIEELTKFKPFRDRENLLEPP